MFAKFVITLALAVAVSASDISSFSYGVADPYTGDFKHQIENRVNDNVQGQYSLLESDGTRRTVDYAAGAEGFNAIVRKDPALLTAAPVVAAPAISYAAPAISYGGPAISYAAGAYPYATPYGLAKYGAIGLRSAFPYSGLYY